MANRGMLPKFRPATLGGREVSARPTIRPVKPTAPPPPPSPPRRVSSGVRHPAPHGEAIEHDEFETSTASYQDPPTMAAARERVHEIARALPSQYDGPRFDDETQARPLDDGLIMASRYQAPRHVEPRRAEPLDVPYESLPSLEAARPYDEYEAEFAERDPETQNRQGFAHDAAPAFPEPRERRESGERYREEYSEPAPPPKYNTNPYPGTGAGEDSGPRQRPRKDAAPVPNYDAAAYEANYPGARRDDSYPDRQESYKASRRDETYRPELRRDDSHAQRARRDDSYQPEPRREGSHPKARRDDSYQAAPRRDDSYQAEPRREDSYEPIPQAPAVPHDMKVPAGFVMGVQPIRTPGSVVAPMRAYESPLPEAFPAPQHASPTGTPMMGVPYGQPVQAPSPRAMHVPAQQMHIRPVTAGRYAQPVGHQLQMTAVEAAPQGSKVGRFAWFVFGAAFGIFFAFFATGFVPRLGKKEEIAFPPPAQLPAQEQAPVAAAPPPVQAQPQPVVAAPPPVVQQPAPPPVIQEPIPQAPAPQPPVMVAAPAMTAPMMTAPVMTAAPAAYPQPVVVALVPAPAPQPVAVAPAPQPRAAAPAPAPAPRGQRAGVIARRNAPAPSAGPKAMPNSGSVDSDDAPLPRTSSSRESKGGGGGDVSGISDLLNAGLAP
ncbi:MAG: hypothetical protein KF764_30370 [Labilithrix sp.]|nr:hypothetical protein [Labilithrix sp.]MBX3222775.1 hypothetical protein [Labilithrix sp.]